VGCFLPQGRPCPFKFSKFWLFFRLLWPMCDVTYIHPTWLPPCCYHNTLAPLVAPKRPTQTAFGVGCLWHAPRCYSARGCYTVPAGHCTLHSTRQGNCAPCHPYPVIAR
jgi:hypothetical protein